MKKQMPSIVAYFTAQSETSPNLILRDICIMTLLESGKTNSLGLQISAFTFFFYFFFNEIEMKPRKEKEKMTHCASITSAGKWNS